MNRSLPALTEAIEDWRDLTSDRNAVDALFEFPTLLTRYQTLQRHLTKLRSQPPQFDTTDLQVVLESLY